MTNDPHDQPDPEHEDVPEDRPGEPGAEGGSRSHGEEKHPADSSEEDDSAFGDTDQHSTG